MTDDIKSLPTLEYPLKSVPPAQEKLAISPASLPNLAPNVFGMANGGMMFGGAPKEWEDYVEKLRESLGS